MKQRTELDEMAADLRNKLTYAVTLIDVIGKNNRKPSKEELKLALEELEEVAKILTQVSRL